jgi:hypothetical protein
MWDIAVGLATPFTVVGLCGSADGEGDGTGRDVLSITAAVRFGLAGPAGGVCLVGAGVREEAGLVSGSAARFSGAGETERVLATEGVLGFAGAALFVVLFAGCLPGPGAGALARFSVFAAVDLAERAFAVAGLPAGRRVVRVGVAAAAAFVFTDVRLPPDFVAGLGVRVVDAARLVAGGLADFVRDGVFAVLALVVLVALTLVAAAFADGLPEAPVRRTPPRATTPPDAGVDTPAFIPSPFIATIPRSSARTRRRAVRYGRHRPTITPLPHGGAARSTHFLDRRCARSRLHGCITQRDE